MPTSDRELDLVLQGATGFTGRLVAAYLLGRYGAGGELRWAIAGRSRTKLDALREEIARETGRSADELPGIVGDAEDAESMTALARRARVVCTTVGPYAKYGSPLVAACAREGTHYCDLTGEVPWMRRMIDAHEQSAAQSGARIVHCCGFDCIPFDLGVFFVQREMRRRHGLAARTVKGRVKSFRGGASGGTIATMLNTVEEAARDPAVRRLLADPYALDPKGRRSGPEARDRRGPAWDADFGQWTAPFVMAVINTRVVRRTSALLSEPYGSDFRYDEAVLTGAGPAGYAKAAAAAAGTGAAMLSMAVGPLRRAARRFLPAPGEGPDAAARARGRFEVLHLAVHPEDRSRDLCARVVGDRDPGYGSTAKMLGESAVCLARDALSSPGGFLTPAAAMGEALLERLPRNAGVSFAIEERAEGGGPGQGVS